jgi:enoyl-CoA hydratase
MIYSTLTLREEGSTLIISINRPDKLNALNQGVMSELDQAMDAFLENKNLLGAIITGTGEKAFAAGADIQEFIGLDATAGKVLSQKGQKLFFKIENSPKPIIADVNGFALGGGCELAMACHLRIASTNAMFGQPEVKLGLLPGYGGTQRLVQLIGKGKATEFLITGDMIDADAALELGLVNYITTRGELLDKCHEILRKAANQGPLAIAYTLQAIADGVNGKDGYATEAELFGKAIVSEDAKEGTAAFLEKRRANFQGK